MSGKPGRSGGARPGSGPKPKPPARINIPSGQDPLDFLLAVMDHPEVDPKLRVRAAVAAAQYVHSKKGEGGKKDGKQEAADRAGQGKFAPAAPPKLVVNNK